MLAAQLEFAHKVHELAEGHDVVPSAVANVVEDHIGEDVVGATTV